MKKKDKIENGIKIYPLPEDEAKKGKKPFQKLKPYIVLQYLLKETDENHAVDSTTIIKYLNDIGIDAERRSIYKDVETINQVMWLLEKNKDKIIYGMEDAEAAIAEDYDDEEKFVVYDKNRKGYYVRQRHYNLNDIRLLAECVYSSKFISQAQANRLSDVVFEFVSKKQAEKIKHNAIVVDRVKTTNKNVLDSISVINDAMSTVLDGQRHEPCKIKFQYMKHTINNLKQTVNRRSGETYIVSPYQMLIDNGNYYLLAFDDRYKEIRTYRVDRMKGVSFCAEPREGEDIFKEIDLKTYTQRVFSMYGGKQERVAIRFTNGLLDTVIDRFGTQNAVYRKLDDWHFEVITKVEISDQFFGWMCCFGGRVKITSPDSVVKKFVSHLDKIRKKYECTVVK